MYLAIKAAWPQQRRIQHVRPVGGGDYDNSLITLKPVHLDEQLVKGLFSLIMTAAEPRSSLAPNGVNFVNKYDARRVFLCLFEHVSNP